MNGYQTVPLIQQLAELLELVNRYAEAMAGIEPTWFIPHCVLDDKRTVEQQLAEWMLDGDIDVNRVFDYIRECEVTRLAISE